MDNKQLRSRDDKHEFNRRSHDRQAATHCSGLGDNAPLVLIGAGTPIPKPGGADQTYPFLAHPEYYWLTGSQRSGGVMAYDPRDGWTHFVRPVDATERLWEGEPDVVEGVDVAQFENWLKARSGRPIAVLGSPIPNVVGDETLAATDARAARCGAARKRRRRNRVRESCDSCDGRGLCASPRGDSPWRHRTGDPDRDRGRDLSPRRGWPRLRSIVGAGSRAAILHSTPGPTIVGRDDVVLIDAGGEVAGYTADVTRTFPAGDRFTPEQQAIYDLVLAAELAAIAKCRDGVEWHDVHRTAASVLAAGLVELGILKIAVDEALDTEAIALFFPHGIGHMVGLGVRDVGGRVPGREEGRKCCGAKVRVDLPIRANFLMTVEPGLYFVPAPARRPRAPRKVQGRRRVGRARSLAQSRRRAHRGRCPHHGRRTTGADRPNPKIAEFRDQHASEVEMIDQLKPGDVINVPLRRDDTIENRSAELLPRLIVWFYEGTNLAAPPVKGIAAVEEALRIVRERYPSAHFAGSLDADRVAPVDNVMERDLITIVFPFYASEMPAEHSVGVIEWFAQLRH